MKNFLLFLLLCLLTTSPNVHSAESDNHKKWLIDSYEFGKTGENCSEILYNYGTPQWTVSSDDPELLEQLFNSCVVGEQDKSTGQNNLPQLLNNLENKP